MSGVIKWHKFKAQNQSESRGGMLKLTLPWGWLRQRVKVNINKISYQKV